MKTNQSTTNYYLKWESFLKVLLASSDYWSLPHFWHGAYSLLVRKSRSLSYVLVDKARVFLAQMNLAISSINNARVFIGLGLIGVVTPLAACLYLLFDRSVVVEGWYHQNMFYLFMLLGPYLSYIVGTIGVFLLFPHGVKRAYSLTLPLGLFIAKTIWLIQTTSNAEYWQLPTWSFVATGLLIAFVLLICLDWLVWVKCHREDSFKARFESIYQIHEGLPLEKIGSMFIQTMRDKKNFEKQI